MPGRTISASSSDLLNLDPADIGLPNAAQIRTQMKGLDLMEELFRPRDDDRAIRSRRHAGNSALEGEQSFHHDGAISIAVDQSGVDNFELSDFIDENQDDDEKMRLLARVLARVLATEDSEPEDEEAKEHEERARKLGDSIFQHCRDLKAILLLHEDRVRKRWTKKTTKARRELLLEALPGISKAHRPDIATYRRQRDREAPGRTKAGQTFPVVKLHQNFAAYALPHLNLEDLSAPRNLLLMLESRARLSPIEFFPIEWRACQLAREANLEIGLPIRKHFAISEQVLETYGQLISSDEADGLLESGQAVTVRKAIFVLKAQEILYRFLVHITALTLSNIPEEELRSDMADAVLEDFPMPPGPELSSPVALAAEVMYRAPPQINFDRLVALVQGRLTATEDHICLMREDPSYYNESMLDWYQHRMEQIRDGHGNKHKKLLGDGIILWEGVLRNGVHYPLIWLEYWAAVLEQLHTLKQYHDSHKNDLAQDAPPDSYAYDICRLKYYCMRIMGPAFQALKHGFFGQPTIRSNFQREVNSAGQSGFSILHKPGTFKHDDGLDMFVFLVEMIFGPRTRETEGRDIILQMDEIQRLIEKQKCVQEVLTSWFMQQLADVLILSQCIYELDVAFPYKIPDHEARIQADFKHSIAYSVAIGEWKYIDPAVVRLVMPNLTKFQYPINKSRTRENVDVMVRAEETLDDVWKALDQHFSTDKIQSHPLPFLPLTPRVGAVLAIRRKQRTLPWDENRDAKQKKGPLIDDYQPMSDIHFELGTRKSRTEQPDLPIVIRTKEKTRGVAQPDAENAEEGPAPESPAEKSFEVDKGALKVFRTIFFTPSPGALPGDVPWLDFVHALASTGFTGEKPSGSVWSFTPTKLDVENSIQFHEPHPPGKIPYLIARRHGRRLARNYGWHADLFKLKES